MIGRSIERLSFGVKSSNVEPSELVHQHSVEEQIEETLRLLLYALGRRIAV
jgi:hypothetical protein